MKYVAIFLMLLSLTACISNKTSGINMAMGVPEMLMDGDLKPNTLKGVATEKRKPTVPVDMEDADYYNQPSKPSYTDECSPGKDC